MKKTATVFLALIVLLYVILTSCEYNPDQQSKSYDIIQGLEYQTNEDGTGYIVSGATIFLKPSITIPNKYLGKPVTGISPLAFNNCQSLKNIKISNGIETIGIAAFQHCANLKSVTLPESITSIEGATFLGCSSLVDIIIPNSITSIGDNAFRYCDSLTNITIPNSIASIGDDVFTECKNLIYNEYDNGYYLGSENNPYTIFVKTKSTDISTFKIHENTEFIHSSAFADCIQLESIILPENVKSIHSSAFIKCKSLTNISVPDNLTKIGEYAFQECINLTDFTIPNSVLTIGSNAFKDCSNLIYNEYENGNYLGNTNNPYILFIKPTNLNITSCKIHQNTKFIHCAAFKNCEELTTITIPESIIYIDNLVFSNCLNLKTIHTTSIEAWCNIKFDNLTSNPLYYGGELYINNTLVTDLLIPNNVTKINNYTFSGCSSLTSIIIPDSVQSIGGGAFQGCLNLTNITISDSVTHIGLYAIPYSPNLTNITFNGTIAQWNAITKGSSWNYRTGDYTITCTNGTIAKDGTVTYS